MKVTLRELLITAVTLCVLACVGVAVLGPMRSTYHPERSTTLSLKTFASAQADFMANDRDKNRTPDFWTGDVYGLYGLRPLQEAPAGELRMLPDTDVATECIRLIEPSVARADGGFTPTPGYSRMPPARAIEQFSPKRGYYYRAFPLRQREDGSLEALTTDTDGPNRGFGALHHPTRFAIGSFPARRAAGAFIFVITEEFAVHRAPVGPNYAADVVMDANASRCVCRDTGLPQGALLEGERIALPHALPSAGFAKID